MTMVTDRNRQRPVKAATYRRSCLVCGMIYNYVPAGKDKGHEHKRGLFCSWACKSAHIKANKPPPFSPIFNGSCKTCSAVIIARRKRLYCSDACMPKVAYIGPTTTHMTAFKDCNVCGEEFEYKRGMGRPPNQCGDACRAEVEKRLRRVAKGRRKAKMRSVPMESVDPIKVCERDGWRCMICGVETPKELRGTWKLNAPEVDHIMPISKGGPHTYANTQCACRKCNMEKSDTVVEAQHVRV